MPSSNTVGHNSSSKKAMIEFATDSYSSLILDIIYYMNILYINKEHGKDIF